MCKLSPVRTIMLVAVAISLSLLMARADPPQPKTNGQPSVQESVQPSVQESIEVRFARAHLALANLDLRCALECNKRMPHLLPAETIEDLQRHVLIDEEELKQCLLRKNADRHLVYLRAAESALANAEADLQRKRALLERMPTWEPAALNAQRAEFVVEIAKLNVERIRGQSATESSLTHMQWQIDDLRHQILEMRIEN